MPARLAVADPAGGSAPPPSRGLTVPHVVALLGVLGFTALMALTGVATPFSALFLALGALAGTLVITSLGSVARAVLRGAVTAARQEQAQLGQGTAS